MNLSTVKSRLGKYLQLLSQLNKSEKWGLIRSIFTYFDYIEAFTIHGCYIDQYVYGKFYQYKNYYRKRVITQRRLEKIIQIANNPNEIHLLENKAHFNRHFNQWVNREWLSSESMTIDDLKNLCQKSNFIFIKPLDEYEGKGIRRIEVPSSDSAIKALYEELKRGNHIIEEELIQHPKMVFGNKSVNTLRINTVLDKNENVHFFKPVLRAGIGDAHVDNYNAGGVEYAIDAKTGIIIMPGYCQGELKQIYHPGTQIKMVGYQIPLWQEVLDSVASAAKHIPGCRYIGWDVAITPHGIEMIEGNHNPGYVCMEYFGETGWYEKIKHHI